MLTVTTLDKFSRQKIDDNFSYFSQKTSETVCIKCQNLFSPGIKEKNIAEALNRDVTVIHQTIDALQ